MEYGYHSKNLVRNKVDPLAGGVRLTGGRLKEAFDNNVRFLKRFDLDRMLFWFREHAGVPAPGAPYGYDFHFENRLKGQTAGQFLMGAGTLLLWQEDAQLRQTMDALIWEIKQYGRDDGCIIPVADEVLCTDEYPNYVRAWLTFGLLAAGYAGNRDAFGLARGLGDWFNSRDFLPTVKDLNLGFQGILANTELYRSPVGVQEDLDVAQNYYREDFWLEWLDAGDHRAIYRKPGNHPHGTLLTTLEGYLDMYRATGEEYLLRCVKKALAMYEDKWQHVGGGIVMCEGNVENYYPGCNLLDPKTNYNELCCTTFWILLNQRMHLLEPDNVHYTDQIEQSIYNVLIASQVEDRGYHYLSFLEKSKDKRFTDIATCCCGTGSRLVSMLPQFLFTINQDAVYVNLYADSDLETDGVRLSVVTDMPYGGRVRIRIREWDRRMLKLRIPGWCAGSVTVGGVTAAPGEYLTLTGLAAGQELELALPFGIRSTLYTGAHAVEGKTRYALEYGPLLLAALRNDAFTVKCDIKNPALVPRGRGRFGISGNPALEYRAYMDIADEPLTVYPVVEEP